MDYPKQFNDKSTQEAISSPAVQTLSDEVSPKNDITGPYPPQDFHNFINERPMMVKRANFEVADGYKVSVKASNVNNQYKEISTTQIKFQDAANNSFI